jgi:hypothetical protein
LNRISSPGAGQSRAKEFFFLFLLAAGAVLVHGYHPFVEDAEIYVPGIKQLLHPALYPLNQVFFASHASMTLYPNLIAWSARLTHFPLEWVLLGWHFGCILLLLAGCWQLGKACFQSERAAWGASLMVGALLTIPVAGTALYIMDQYLNPRSFSTATAIWIIPPGGDLDCGHRFDTPPDGRLQPGIDFAPVLCRARAASSDSGCSLGSRLAFSAAYTGLREDAQFAFVLLHPALGVV